MLLKLPQIFPLVLRGLSGLSPCFDPLLMSMFREYCSLLYQGEEQSDTELPL